MMTYKTLKHCSLVAVTAFCSQLTFAGDVIVTLSPYQSSQQAMTDIQKMTAFAIEREPNERVVFVDGYKLETLGKFVVPDNPEQNKRFSLLENKENISPVFKFGRKAKVGQGEQEPQIVGALLLPQLTQYIAENHVADEPVDLILIGSPFYDNPKEPAYSMAGGLVPSDGHLLQTISKTPYLVKEDRATERKIEQLLDRIVESDSPTVIKALEKRVEGFENQRRVLEEKMAYSGQPVKPFDQMYRTALQFLSKPAQLWASGGFAEKRAVLKLTFSDRLTWDRKGMYRTPQLSLPFNILGDFFMQEKQMVRPKRFELLTP